MKKGKQFTKILQSPCCNKTLKSVSGLKCQKCGKLYHYKNNIPILITKDQFKEDNNNIKTAKDSRFDFEENSLIKALFPPSDTLRIVNKENALIRKLPKNGIALGIGSETKSKKVINLDINPNMNIDIVADITSLPFKDNVFDLVICQYVLEHVKDIKKAISEINRVLTPNGIVYISMPFLQLYHPSPADYNRLTLSGLKFLMKDFQEVETGIGIGPASGLAWILREFVAMFFDNKFLHRITLFITGWLIFPLKYLDLFLVKKKHAYILASSFFYIGKKNLSNK